MSSNLVILFNYCNSRKYFLAVSPTTSKNSRFYFSWSSDCVCELPREVGYIIGFLITIGVNWPGGQVGHRLFLKH